MKAEKNWVIDDLLHFCWEYFILLNRIWVDNSHRAVSCHHIHFTGPHTSHQTQYDQFNGKMYDSNIFSMTSMRFGSVSPVVRMYVINLVKVNLCSAVISSATMLICLLLTMPCIMFTMGCRSATNICMRTARMSAKMGTSNCEPSNWATSLS